MAGWQGTNPDDLLAAHLAGDMTKPFRKEAMREELRRRIAEKTGDPEAVVREIAEYLAGHPHLRTVALFSPLKGEVDVTPIMARENRVWVFPKVDGKRLTLHRVKDAAADLFPGAFGIREPRVGLPAAEAAEVDLFLCPGLGFDTHGGRIGRGKGFYDGLLAKARPGALKIGVCFGHQLVDEVVMEKHDIRMDGVIAG